MDPAVTQPLSQSLVGDVEADNQVELIQTVQGLGLRQCPRKTYTDSRGTKENVSVIFLSATFKTDVCVFVKLSSPLGNTLNMNKRPLHSFIRKS